MKDDHASKRDLSTRADEIYFAAFEFEDENERSIYVEEACAGDPALHKEVIRLFEMEEQAAQLFQVGSPALITAADIVNTLDQTPAFFENMEVGRPDDEVGNQIGNYNLLQKIGEGGVGCVYMAEQLKPVRRQVALKVIKAGMDTKSVIARFEAERQALAMMEHPNISHVLNAGETESGRPFFVMDLVHGERITTYCDENRLNVRQRLELFIQVCHAIQHAHQKGIIHRDIKPSNVLITIRNGKPRPVVIDFGIAKATSGDLLTDKTIYTSIEPLIGTPAYMSPEQADAAHTDIDTRSDMYSLGVLLYELLVGQPPFDQKELMKDGLEKMLRTLREREPLPPSIKLRDIPPDEQEKIATSRGMDVRKLCAVLSSDLSWIVMKALEKDRTRRYETVDAMAVDIEHHLNNEPVTARPPGRIYRFQKLVRRNKLTFAYLTLMSISLIAGFATSTQLFIKERKAHNRALLAELQQKQMRVAAEDREHIALAAFLLSQNRIEEADDAVEKITTELTPSLEAESVLRTLGEWHALRQEWKPAAKRFNLLLKVDIKDISWAITGDLLMAGPVLIEAGDVNGYEEFRRAAIEQYRDTADYNAAERTLKISLLTPADESLLKPLQHFAYLAQINTEMPPTEIMGAWRCISLALMSYRQNDMPAAITWSGRARVFNGDPTARVATSYIIQAMAHGRLNEIELAKTNLERGRRMVKNAFADDLEPSDGWNGYWYDWLFARILLHEAEELIKG